jgi:hypothetical protein
MFWQMRDDRVDAGLIATLDTGSVPDFVCDLPSKRKENSAFGLSLFRKLIRFV